MKLFPEFRSCWGGSILSSAAEATIAGQQWEEQGGYSQPHGHRTSKRSVKVRPRGGAITHWKPKLNAIYEDSPTPEVDRGGVNRRTAGSNNKKLSKVNPKPPAKAVPPLNHVEDYWKSSQAMAIPAFSPTSFLF